MKLAIFGANGKTGRILTRRAVDEGHEVTAFTRHPESFPVSGDRLVVVGGDVFDLEAVDAAVAGQDAVLSSLGVPYSRRPIHIYSEGIANILAAMRQQGVRRLVCVSSSAADSGIETDGGFFFTRVLVPMITHTIGKTTYADQRRMEKLVMDSDVDWTIVRPSGLFEAPAVTDYRVTEGQMTGRFTSRRDLADFLFRLAGGDGYVRRAPALATVSGQPPLVKLLWREAISHKAA
ncbi:MAG: SDR family oxidoreductase [Candidatus Dormiibacterota bacterium]